MIELACITDSSFARHTGAMIRSALVNSPGDDFTVHVLHDGTLGDTEMLRLEETTRVHRAKLSFVAVPPVRTALFSSGYFPRCVWFRVLLPELLPKVKSVLYLDSDLVITDTLAPLWETGMSEDLVAAVTNPFYPFMPDHPRLRLGIDPADYFNSGVLLMNLERMRTEGIVNQCLRFARAHPGSDYPDQDCLNHVCRNRWTKLHPRWNVQSPLYELPASRLPWPQDAVAEAITHPAIVHFIGPFKPWQYVCRHPQRSLYFQHARATPWGEPALEGRTLRNAVIRQLPLAWIDRIYSAERRAAGLLRRLAS